MPHRRPSASATMDGRGRQHGQQAGASRRRRPSCGSAVVAPSSLERRLTAGSHGMSGRPIAARSTRSRSAAGGSIWGTSSASAARHLRRSRGPPRRRPRRSARCASNARRSGSSRTPSAYPPDSSRSSSCVMGSLPEAAAQHLAQPQEPAANPGLDRAERLLEPCRDVALRQPLVVGELDCLPLRRAEGGQRGPHPRALFAADRLDILPGRAVGDVRGIRARPAGAIRDRRARSRSSVRARAITSSQPITGRPRRIVQPGLPPRLGEDVLHHILGFRRVCKHPQRQRVDGPGVTIVEVRHRRRVTPRHPGDGYPIVLECSRRHAQCHQVLRMAEPVGWGVVQQGWRPVCPFPFATDQSRTHPIQTLRRSRANGWRRPPSIPRPAISRLRFSGSPPARRVRGGVPWRTRNTRTARANAVCMCRSYFACSARSIPVSRRNPRRSNRSLHQRASAHVRWP